jgi:hypothetical protein
MERGDTERMHEKDGTQGAERRMEDELAEKEDEKEEKDDEEDEEERLFDP